MSSNAHNMNAQPTPPAPRPSFLPARFEAAAVRAFEAVLEGLVAR